MSKGYRESKGELKGDLKKTVKNYITPKNNSKLFDTDIQYLTFPSLFRALITKI